MFYMYMFCKASDPDTSYKKISQAASAGQNLCSSSLKAAGSQGWLCQWSVSLLYNEKILFAYFFSNILWSEWPLSISKNFYSLKHVSQLPAECTEFLHVTSPFHQFITTPVKFSFYKSITFLTFGNLYCTVFIFTGLSSLDLLQEKVRFSSLYF